MLGPLAGDQTTRHPLNYVPSQLPPSPTDHEYRKFPLLLCPTHEGSKVVMLAKVCTDTESSVVGSLSMGVASVMSTLSFLWTMTSSTTI